MFSYIIGRMPVTRRVAPSLIVGCVAVSASAQEPATPVVQTPLRRGASAAATPAQSPALPNVPAACGATCSTLPGAIATTGARPVTMPVARRPHRRSRPPAPAERLVHKIQAASERLEMTVNSSRILTLDQPIPRLVVGNPDLVQATPLSPTEVQIFAKKVGATQVNLFTEKGQVFSVDCIIYGDVRQLTDLLRVEFPTANISVKAIAEGHVLLTGYVDRSDHIAQIVQLAHTFFPAGSGNAADDRVISNIEVVGVQQILLKVKVAEVSRTKLRQLGMDWANIHGSSFVVSSIGDVIASTQAIAGSAGIGNDTIRFGVVNGTFQLLRIHRSAAAARPGQDSGRARCGHRQRPAGTIPRRRTGAVPQLHQHQRRERFVHGYRRDGRFPADRAGQRQHPPGSAPGGSRTG